MVQITIVVAKVFFSPQTFPYSAAEWKPKLAQADQPVPVFFYI
jgi:hypothetical protein